MNKQTLTRENYDTVLRGMGMVDSGLSSSRGSYLIMSYKFSAAKRKQGFAGFVEVHTDAEQPTYFLVTQSARCKGIVIVLDVEKV